MGISTPLLSVTDGDGGDGHAKPPGRRSSTSGDSLVEYPIRGVSARMPVGPAFIRDAVQDSALAGRGAAWARAMPANDVVRSRSHSNRRPHEEHADHGGGPDSEPADEVADACRIRVCGQH